MSKLQQGQEGIDLMSSYTPNRTVLGLELVASDDLLAKYSKLEIALNKSKVETNRTRKPHFLRMILYGEIAKSINVSANEEHLLDDNTIVSSKSVSQLFKELDTEEPIAKPTSCGLEKVKALQVMPSYDPLTFLSPIYRFLCADNNCIVLDTTDNDDNVDIHSINTAFDERAVKPTETYFIKSFATTLKCEELERFILLPVNDSNVESSSHNATTNQSNITTFPTKSIIINTVSDGSDLSKDDLLLSDANDVTESDLLMTSKNSSRCESFELVPSSKTENDRSLVLSTCEDSVPFTADISMIKSQSIERGQSKSCKSYEDVEKECPSEEKSKPTLTSHEVTKKMLSVVGVVLRFVARKRRNNPIATVEHASDSPILVDDGQSCRDHHIKTGAIHEDALSVLPNLVDDGQKSVYQEFLALFDNSDKAEYHDKAENYENDVCSAVLNLNDHLLDDDADMVTEKSRSVDDACSTDSPTSVERFPSSSPDMIDDHSLGSNLLPYAMVHTDKVYDDYHCVQPMSKLTDRDRVAKVFLQTRSGGYEITDCSREIQDDMDDNVNHKSGSSQTTESGIISITCSTISSIKCASSLLPSQNHHVINTTAAIPSVVKCLTTPTKSSVKE